MGLYARIVAAAYDRFTAANERAGMADLRRAVLAQAAGRTLEIGAGTGLNLDHYPPAIEELVLSEPEPAMAKRLMSRASQGRRCTVVEADAESLPFADDSFDTVAGTLVLCTIPDHGRALAEIARVLKPEGSYLFIEHVRSDDPRLAKWQDRLHWPWLKFTYGCHCNRDTLSTIGGSPLAFDRVEHGQMPKGVPIVRPLVWGSATKTAA